MLLSVYLDKIIKMRGDTLGISVATIGAISGLIIILIKKDPLTASSVTILLFYFSMFLAIWGGMTMAGYEIRRLITGNFIHDKIFNTAFWQGLIIAGMIIGFLILNKFFAWIPN